MIDAKMKRTMKWRTDGYSLEWLHQVTSGLIDADPVWVVAAKKALENLDRDSLRRLLNSHYGLLPTQVDYMTQRLIWLELQRRNIGE